MQNMLHQQSQQGGLLPTTLTFSAQTTSIATQEMIEAKLERRHRNRKAALASCHCCLCMLTVCLLYASLAFACIAMGPNLMLHAHICQDWAWVKAEAPTTDQSKSVSVTSASLSVDLLADMSQWF